MSLSLNQPFLRSILRHFPLFQPFLEVFTGLALDQLLKGFPHGLLPGELPHHHKTDFIFLLLAFFHTGHPLPEGSQRAATYNPVLAKLEKLIAAMRGIGRKYGASVSQVAIAWAACKGTIPLVGVTKPTHVSEAASAVKIFLTQEEVAELERLASDTGVDTKGSWENPMV